MTPLTQTNRIFTMSEFQLSHVALVGARMDSFNQYGFTSRNQLKAQRITPLPSESALEKLDRNERLAMLAAQLPVWVHNIITDPDFPERSRLLMALRRFEGELKDKRDNEVISAVMSAGFKSQTFNPLDLPKTMPLRRRCSVVAHIGVWQEAYQKLEQEIVSIMSEKAPAVARWCDQAAQPDLS
jgi:hypothetical protein